ncbi:diacylglycerol kinase [Aliiroseovarius sp.]|uniref:diacylglycerol kinase n=1 Tax=Aliiroseovarius sp. TaxID=1872442 RepID=UPI0026156047|nr:diacylglycerol kinase [Aliiroseovarius sp.]
MGLRDTFHREWTRFKWRAIWSWRGWLDCWRNEKSLMQWVWANIASAALAMVLDLTGGERALILALGILILAAELMNTAVERTVDYISTEEHDLARRAKDLASGAVAITAIAAGVAWVAILIG